MKGFRQDLMLRLATLLLTTGRKAENERPQLIMNDYGVVEEPSDPIGCGTSCCALGLAALSGEFKDEGLRACVAMYGTVTVWHSTVEQPSGAPVDHRGLAAAWSLFGIAPDVAHYLFMPGSYARPPTMGQVARRIYQVVASHGELSRDITLNGHLEA